MFKYGILSAIAFTTLLFSSCKNEGKEHPYTTESPAPTQEQLAAGFHLMESNCFSCHSPNAATETKTGPTMAAIKEAYLEGDNSLSAFTNDFIAFHNNPSEANSKMPEAIKKFNLMPKMSLSDEQITNIAAYIYISDIEKPDWFANTYPGEKEKYASSKKLSPLEAGQEIALKTKGVLGKNLLKALNAKGTEEALSFCSTRAIPLTDSMSIALNAHIKRVSDNNRNPDNAANENELAYITATKAAIAKGEKPTPQLITTDDKHIGYYPIMTNQMCLQCHGVPVSDIKPSTLTKIKEHYPNDLATGYGIDQLRGIWVVEMDKER